MFEKLRAAVNAALDAAMPPTDWHDLRGQMHSAAVEGRAAVAKMRDDLEQAERALAAERTHLDDARRRGQLASEIDDAETVEVARRFEAKHGERVDVLAQKVEAQRAELALAEREVAEMVAQLRELERRGTAGVRDPEVGDLPDGGEARLKHEMDRAAREAAADAQLRELKKRMGR